MLWRLLVVSLLGSLLLGCEEATVLALQPKPNISLPRPAPTVALEVAPSIRDTYALPAHDGIGEVTVHAWQGTLNNGFRNAFGTRGASSDTFTLVLEHAELTFVPAVLSTAGVVGIRAQIRYRGRWVGADGEMPFSGTAESKHATPKTNELDRISTSAVESMYEAIWGALASSH